MLSEPTFRAVRVTAAVGWIVVAIMVVMLSLPAFERYEARLHPVVRDFSIDDARPIEGGDAVVAVGRLVKNRDCRFLRLTVYAGDVNDPLQPRERLGVAFLDQVGDSDRSREPGYQNWGPWRIDAPSTAAGPHLFLRVSHHCHPLYETRGVYFVTGLRDVFRDSVAAWPGQGGETSLGGVAQD